MASRKMETVENVQSHDSRMEAGVLSDAIKAGGIGKPGDQMDVKDDIGVVQSESGKLFRCLL